MQGYVEISTSSWRLKLPDDWVDLQDEEAVAHFGSGDETKSVYIGAYQLGPEKGGTEEERVQWLVENEMANRAGMEGYNWAIVGPQFDHEHGVCSIVLDSFDEARQYRIVTKILLSGEDLVRAAFHDYLVEDIEQSIAYFAPALQSLNYHGAAA